MSHKCGSRRKLDAGGRTRTLSRHFLDSPHKEITRKIVAATLDNWTIKGVRTDAGGRESMNYLAYSPDLGRLVRVVVSMDDQTIVSAFQDGNATRALNRGDTSYFKRAFKDLEIRHEPRDSV